MPVYLLNAAGARQGFTQSDASSLPYTLTWDGLSDWPAEWTIGGGGSSAVTNDRGRLTTGAAASSSEHAYLTNMPSTADVEVLQDYIPPTTLQEMYVGIGVRGNGVWTGYFPGTGYWIEIDPEPVGGYVGLYKANGSGGATALVTDVPFTFDSTAVYRVRLQVVGTTIRAKFWDTAGAEPSTWTVSATDSTWTTGRAFFTVSNGSAGGALPAIFDTYSLAASTIGTSEPPTTGGTATTNPVYIASGAVTSIGGNSYKTQHPGQPWSMLVDNTGTTHSVHELRDGDFYNDGVTNRQRSELRNQGYLHKTLDNWVSGAFRYNGSFGSDYCLISQYHQPPGSPVIGWTIIGGILEIYTRGASTHPSTNPSSVTRFTKDLNALENQWLRMIMRVRLGSAGQMDFWVNGVALGATKTNIPISYWNDADAPYEKHGIYRANFAGTLKVDWVNWECGTANLSDRIANPLPVPA